MDEQQGLRTKHIKTRRFDVQSRLFHRIAKYLFDKRYQSVIVQILQIYQSVCRIVGTGKCSKQVANAIMSQYSVHVIRVIYITGIVTAYTDDYERQFASEK